jgi:hypothetical protein
MEDNFGIKELYDVALRATYPITIGEREFLENEAILRFEKIQIAPINEQKVRSYARGGKENMRLIDWETTNSVDFSFSEGVISKIGLALLSNSVLEKHSEPITTPMVQNLESNQDGIVKLRYEPIKNGTLFIYDKNTSKKITNYEINGNTIDIKRPYCDVIVDYTFYYNEPQEIYSIGSRLFDGYLKLDAKIRLRDDEDGHIKTVLLEIPKVKLMSSLNLRLGRDISSPHVYRFILSGFPVRENGERYVCKMAVLGSEILQDGEE